MDEDQIEATIRRVAEAKAAREGSAPAPEAVAAPRADATSAPAAVAPRAQESTIEATIRRVAEAQAARAAEGAAEASQTDSPLEHEREPGQPGTPDEAAVEDTMRRVQAARAGMTGHAAPTTEPARAAGPLASRQAVEESAIEAAIRRVAESKAAREREAAVDDTDGESGVAVAPALETERHALLRPAPAAWRLPAGDADRGDGHDLMQAVAQLRRDLDETKLALDALTRRFDAAQVPGLVSEAPAVSDSRGEWYDAPAPRAADATEDTPTQEDAESAISAPPTPQPPPRRAEPKRGLDLLPRTYRITVEDKRRGVDLVPLHRALLGMDGVKDMSLLSYSNGVAIVSMEVVNELNPETLGRAISRAMSRETKVEVHNEQTMVVKLAEE